MNATSVATAARPADKSYTLLFSTPFRSEMTERACRLLRSLLHMTLTFEHKRTSALQGPGFVRLDLSSGLLLLPAGADDEWVVECRSWHPPGPAVIHRWEVETAWVLSLIDSSVVLPPVAEPPERCHSR